MQNICLATGWRYVEFCPILVRQTNHKFESGSASAVKTQEMTVKVEVRDGETIQEALRRLRHAVRHAHRRQWYKTRPGSYDKPSYRRRRQEVLRRRNMRRNRRPGYVTVYVGLTGLFAPTAPFT